MRALARVEARHLLRHPLVLAGVGISLLGIAMFVGSSVSEPGSTWEDDGWTAGVGFLMLGILTMVATNAASLRDRRSDTIEQHASLPIERSTRTAGLLGSTMVPAALALLLLGAVTGYAASRESLAVVELVHLVEVAVLCVTLGALGIALAAWFPSPFVAPVFAWGLFIVSPGDSAESWHLLAPFALGETSDVAWWHLAYLVGLAVVFGVAALGRSTRRRSLVLAGVLGVALTVGGAAMAISSACTGAGVCVS